MKNSNTRTIKEQKKYERGYEYLYLPVKYEFDEADFRENYAKRLKDCITKDDVEEMKRAKEPDEVLQMLLKYRPRYGIGDFTELRGLLVLPKERLYDGQIYVKEIPAFETWTYDDETEATNEVKALMEGGYLIDYDIYKNKFGFVFAYLKFRMVKIEWKYFTGEWERI